MVQEREDAVAAELVEDGGVLVVDADEGERERDRESFRRCERIRQRRSEAEKWEIRALFWGQEKPMKLRSFAHINGLIFGASMKRRRFAPQIIFKSAPKWKEPASAKIQIFR